MDATTNPVQVGAPRLIRLQHSLANAQMYLVAQDQPMFQHYWKIERAMATMYANAAVSGTPPVLAIYSAPSGVFESAAGTLQGVSLFNSPLPQGGDMILLDSGAWSINGVTNIWPYLVADEDEPPVLLENRALVVYIGGYATGAGMVQVDIQYTDWITHVVKESIVPLEYGFEGREQ
jgi:hypothetical protein